MYEYKKYKSLKEPELLAPAGNYTKFIAAVENGADAVYMGLPKYNARSMSENFTMQEFKKALNYAHLRNVKVYLTMNTLLYDDEIKEVLHDIAELVAHGLDAVIVQDLGLASAIHEVFPSLALHASTQLTIYNIEGVKILESLGFTRVVLARELSLDEIREIRKYTSMELEVFIHGAACVCYSGNCQLSNFIGGRSGNRGCCAQPCRMLYELYNSSNEREAQGYLLSNKDLYALPQIEALTNIGIDSLKIEGRNRSPEYVAITVNKYKKYINLAMLNSQSQISYEDERDLMQAFNRGGKHSHYLEGKKGKDSISYICPKNWGIPLGEILEIKKNMLKVRLFTELDLHDGVEALNSELSGIVTCIKDEKGYLINNHVKEGKIVWIGDFKNTKNITENTILYKTTSSRLNEMAQRTFSQKQFIKKNHLSAVVTLRIGKPITITVYNNDYSISLTSQIIVDEAQKLPITKDNITEKLSKTNNSAFEFSNIICDMDDNCFIPISELNKLKAISLSKFTEYYTSTRDISEELEEIKKLSSRYSANIINNINSETISNTKNDVYLYSINSKFSRIINNAGRIFLDYSLVLQNEELLNKYSELTEVYIALPHNLKGNLKNVIVKKLDTWSKKCNGFLIGNLCYFEILKKYTNIKLIGDYSLNVSNNFTITVLNKLGISEYTLSFEIDNKRLSSLNLSHAIIITEGQAQAMVTEYCVVGSFAGQFTASTPCKRPCNYSNNYYLVNSNGKKIKIICDPINCSNRLFMEYNTNLELDNVKIHRKRINLL